MMAVVQGSILVQPNIAECAINTLYKLIKGIDPKLRKAVNIGKNKIVSDLVTTNNPVVIRLTTPTIPAKSTNKPVSAQLVGSAINCITLGLVLLIIEDELYGSKS